MIYRKGDVLLARVVVAHNYEDNETTFLVTPPSDAYSPRSLQRSDIVGVERLKFDPNEPAIWVETPCTVKFVDEATNMAWIKVSDVDRVVPVADLKRPLPVDNRPVLRDMRASAELV